MPVYEYECSGCEKVFELQQRIADPPLRVCPECGGQVRKLISMSSFQLKGSGWYSDGYSNGVNDKGNGKVEAPCADSGTGPSCPGSVGSCCHCPAAS